MTLCDFVKAAPEGFRPNAHVDLGASYKYYVCGKGCTLGVLFEDSINVYFEWLLEDGRPVSHGPELRYKAWPKREFVRLMHLGVWQPTCVGEPA